MTESDLPGNPRIIETVTQFLRRQASLQKPGISECIKCGDCCVWNYYILTFNQEDLLTKLKTLGAPVAHGHWILIGDELNLYMPFWKPGSRKGEFIHFTGHLPKKHIELLTFSKRRHGYWVMTGKDEVICYNPVPCCHLTSDNLCDDYEHRPTICREYYCWRFNGQDGQYKPRMS